MLHVYPIHDEQPHDTASTTCACGPRLREECGDIIVIHRSYDGRELIEEAEAIKKRTSLELH